MDSWSPRLMIVAAVVSTARERVPIEARATIRNQKRRSWAAYSQLRTPNCRGTNREANRSATRIACLLVLMTFVTNGSPPVVPRDCPTLPSQLGH